MIGEDSAANGAWLTLRHASVKSESFGGTSTAQRIHPRVVFATGVKVLATPVANLGSKSFSLKKKKPLAGNAIFTGSEFPRKGERMDEGGAGGGGGGGRWLQTTPVKKSNKRRACAAWAKIPREVKTAAMMRGVNHFGAALMDGKAAAECAGSSGSDGDACIRRSQRARAVAGGALRPARVVLNAGGEWGRPFCPQRPTPCPLENHS